MAAGENIELLPQSALDHHTVYIWMSVELHQFGHASLLLSNGVYISWWPKGKKMKCGPLSKVGNCSMDLQEDIHKEEFEPDYTFYIPKTTLNIDRMANYWNGWIKRGHYALLSRNCCSMVYRVLLKGGAPRSATLVWRPETLRRYVVIYICGGSKTQLFWNWPHTDEHYKEKHTLFVWNQNENNNGHASLNFEGIYISWSPFIQSEKDDADWVNIQHGRPSTCQADDMQRMGRAPDLAVIFRPKYLDVSDMKRRWKKFIGEEKNKLWGTNSFWLISQILIAGGAPVSSKSYDYWSGKTLQTYIKRNFVTEKQLMIVHEFFEWNI